MIISIVGMKGLGISFYAFYLCCLLLYLNYESWEHETKEYTCAFLQVEGRVGEAMFGCRHMQEKTKIF